METKGLARRKRSLTFSHADLALAAGKCCAARSRAGWARPFAVFVDRTVTMCSVSLLCPTVCKAAVETRNAVFSLLTVNPQ